MNLDELYDQILNTKKQKILEANKLEKNQDQNKLIEDFYDINNFAIYTEINIFSKFHFEWFFQNFSVILYENLIIFLKVSID